MLNNSLILENFLVVKIMGFVDMFLEMGKLMMLGLFCVLFVDMIIDRVVFSWVLCVLVRGIWFKLIVLVVLCIFIDLRFMSIRFLLVR